MSWIKRHLILVLIALLTINILLYFLYANARTRAYADADRELDARAQIIANSIDRLLQIRMVETFTFAALPSLRGFIASDETTRESRIAVARSELQSIVTSDSSILAASIVGTSGLVVLTTDGSMNADWSARLFVREGMMGHLHASGPAHDFGELSQYYSAPVLDNFGKIAGVLVLRISAQELWDIVRGVPDVLVLDENSVRIVDTSSAPQILAAIAPLSNDAIARAISEKRYGSELAQIPVVPLLALANQINGNLQSANFADTKGTANRAAIKSLQTNPWSVIVIAREDAMLASTNAIAWQSFGLGIIATSAVGLFLYLVRRPIQANDPA